ncbi:hypothetical protein J3A83DRAFT_4372179 [Scleroderma citrinum]
MNEPSTHGPLPTSARRSALKQPSMSRPSSPPQMSPPTTNPRDGGVPSPVLGPVQVVHPTRSTSSSSIIGPLPGMYTPRAIRPPTAVTSTTIGTFTTGASIASQGYTPKVSFDTFENPAASMFSYTLRVQSDGYARTTATRVFLCAASPDESGREALDWVLECLVQDADELVVFRGIDQDELGKSNSTAIVATYLDIKFCQQFTRYGRRTDKDHELVREEARELMRQIQEKCVEYDPERKLSIILEFIAGRTTTTLDRLIALYRPDSVIVGTRGQRSVMSNVSGVLGFGGGGVFSSVGSVSRYALSHSPVPVIVVRPERKVRKVLEKRRRDPKRGTHFDE